MSITFPTTDLKVPSGITALPSEMKRPGFGTLYGFDAQGGGGAAFSSTKSVHSDGTNDDMYLDSAIAFTGAFTLSLWFIDTDGLDFPYLVNPYLFIYGPSYGRSIYVRNVGTITAVGAYSDDTWYNIVLKRDGSDDVTLYRDGTSIGTSSGSGTITFRQFGRGGSWGSLGGNMDEIALWDSALSDSDRHAIRGGVAAGTRGLPSNLDDLSSKPAHWWRCGDGDDTGTTSEDVGQATPVPMQLRNGASFEAEVPS